MHRMKSEKYDTIVIPDNLSQRVRKGIRQGEKVYLRNKRKKIMIKIATSAAAMAVCVGVFASQPALASKIPVIRNIFKLLQEDYSYQGDLDSVAHRVEESEGAEDGQSAKDMQGKEGGRQLGENENTESGNGDPAYTRTVDGVTVTVSESYCSVEAIYLSLTITSEEGFPATMINENTGKPILYLLGTIDYHFCPAESEAAGYARGGTGSLEGVFLDEHTYAGIYRIDILDIVGNDDTLKEQYRTLDAFDMDYTINRIVGEKAEPTQLDMRGKTEEDILAMSDEEWRAFMDEITPEDWGQFPNKYEEWWYDGPFTFQLHIETDKESVQVVTVDEMNETGAGLYRVVKTKFEITVEEKCNEERTASGVFNVVLDADGILLPYGSSSFADTFAINGRDVSKVFVYVCDYDEYMDEIKGHREDADFRQILEERALYSKEIIF